MGSFEFCPAEAEMSQTPDPIIKTPAQPMAAETAKDAPNRVRTKSVIG